MKRTLEPAPVLTEPVAATAAPARPKRSLKRTASAASLPTPPRTTHKKRKTRDSKYVDEEEEDVEEFESSEDEKPIKPVQRAAGKNKVATPRAKSSNKATEQETEDAFWLGSPKDNDNVEPRVTTPKKVPSTIGSAPVSPPPSRSNQIGPQFKTPSPKHKRVASVASSSGGRPIPVPEEDDSDGPIRDSPNNLFLSNSRASHPHVPLDDEDKEYEPKPTVTYVFRGKRVEFPNPHYNLPPEVHARAKLPLEHPDFSPSPDVKPRRLFADDIAEIKKPKRKRSITLPSPSPSPTRPKRKVTTIKKQRTVVTTTS
ncbi:hypothetical protein FRB91_010704 [Serendipita sp. 411]|nr:hypothetical protein FRB91_010704 [Serendipita sp. 411]